MQKPLFAAFALAGVIGAASGALAASPTPVHRLAHHAAPSQMQKGATRPVQVMTEKPVANPSLGDVFAASDGQIYVPSTNDPRSHGLPNF